MQEICIKYAINMLKYAENMQLYAKICNMHDMCIKYALC